MAKWKIDPDHSVGAFSIRHMTVAFVHGQLNKVSGTVDFDPDNIAGLAVEIEIDTDSIITGIGKRDDHLKSADFFDIKKYPKYGLGAGRIRPLQNQRKFKHSWH
jgi:polyisoprenoid-binding protein YceI